MTSKMNKIRRELCKKSKMMKRFAYEICDESDDQAFLDDLYIYESMLLEWREKLLNLMAKVQVHPCETNDRTSNPTMSKNRPIHLTALDEKDGLQEYDCVDEEENEKSKNDDLRSEAATACSGVFSHYAQMRAKDLVQSSGGYRVRLPTYIVDEPQNESDHSKTGRVRRLIQQIENGQK